jgi:hypothetical protein
MAAYCTLLSPARGSLLVVFHHHSPPSPLRFDAQVRVFLAIVYGIGVALEAGTKDKPRNRKGGETSSRAAGQRGEWWNGTTHNENTQTRRESNGSG